MDATWMPLWVAIVVATTSLSAPLLLARQLNKNSEKVREKDYARAKADAKEAAELVAERAAETTKNIMVNQVEAAQAAAGRAEVAADLLLASNERVAEGTKITHQTLNVIHTLVNSTLTEQMEGRLEEARKGLTSLLKIVELEKRASAEPSTESLAEIEAARGKIAGLQASLIDRAKQNELAAAQLQEIAASEAELDRLKPAT